MDTTYHCLFPTKDASYYLELVSSLSKSHGTNTQQNRNASTFNLRDNLVIFSVTSWCPPASHPQRKIPPLKIKDSEPVITPVSTTIFPELFHDKGRRSRGQDHVYVSDQIDIGRLGGSIVCWDRKLRSELLSSKGSTSREGKGKGCLVVPFSVKAPPDSDRSRRSPKWT